MIFEIDFYKKFYAYLIRSIPVVYTKMCNMVLIGTLKIKTTWWYSQVSEANGFTPVEGNPLRSYVAWIDIAWKMEFKPTNCWVAITKLTFLRQPILKLGPGRSFSSSSAGMLQVLAKGEGIEKWSQSEVSWEHVIHPENQHRNIDLQNDALEKHIIINYLRVEVAEAYECWNSLSKILPMQCLPRSHQGPRLRNHRTRTCGLPGSLETRRDKPNDQGLDGCMLKPGNDASVGRIISSHHFDFGWPGKVSPTAPLPQEWTYWYSLALRKSHPSCGNSTPRHQSRNPKRQNLKR